MTTNTNDTLRFTAPWGKLLYGMTAVGTTVIGGGMVASLAAPAAPGLALAAVLGGTLLFCAGGAVTGYRLEGDTLVIERAGRDKRVSLRGLTAVSHGNSLMRGALRVGNGGLFVFAGFFWSKQHGWFRLHGNDIIGRAVLLEIGDEKWMITPEHPEAFVAAAEELIGS